MMFCTNVVLWSSGVCAYMPLGGVAFDSDLQGGGGTYAITTIRLNLVFSKISTAPLSGQ